MKQLIHFAFGLFLSIGMFSATQAQAVRNATERLSDKRQINQDKKVIERDRAELQEFAADRAAIVAATNNGNVAKSRNLNAKLVAAMEREIAQGKAKIKQSKNEVAGSRSEVRDSRREVRNTRGTGKPVQTADDRRDRQDDKRDLRDDKSDRNEQIFRNERQEKILAEYRAINVKGPGDAASINAKKRLLLDFENTMRADMGENVEELREDKGELREDRRETREDRRQR